MIIDLSILERDTLVEALETQIEALVDQRMHAEDREAVEARGDDTSEYDELDVCIDEANAVLAKLQALHE